MGLSRRQFTKEFKLAAVRRLEQGVSIGEAARALEVSANVLHRWRREFRQGPGNAFPGNEKQRWSEGRIAELERKLGQQALEIDFLKGCLQRIVPGLPEFRAIVAILPSLAHRMKNTSHVSAADWTLRCRCRVREDAGAAQFKIFVPIGRPIPDGGNV